MVLSDRDIRTYVETGDLTIEPYDRSNVEPASVDLRLGSDFKSVKGKSVAALSDDDPFNYIEKQPPVTLPQEGFMLATTYERVEIPNTLVAHVLGRSSLGRMGVSVHQTAGYIDPGFAGQITLELSNHGPAPVRLRPGDRICQIVFEELSSPAASPYGHEGSQYQDQSGATPSRMSFD